MPKVLNFNKKEDYEFDELHPYEEAWYIFEYYASNKKDGTSFNEVADYGYVSVREFYSSSLDFVKAKVKYRKALEKEFGVKLI